jgi:hypothetical protein
MKKDGLIMNKKIFSILFIFSLTVLLSYLCRVLHKKTDTIAKFQQEG